MADSPEESSWTFYIEGFICDDDNNSCFSSETESPSLLSDAASAAVAKKLTRNRTQGFSSDKYIYRQESIKKQKTYNIIPAMDTDLEDTASSPVNSPKVSYMNPFMNDDDKKEKAKMDVSKVKRNSYGKVFAVERVSNYADLKKRSTFG